MIAGATSAQAQTTVKACATRSVTQAFKQWADLNSYFVAPSGTFEFGIGSWVATGWAWTVAENEPWRVNGSTGSTSAQLMAGGSIRSRSFCVGADEDSVRLFVKRPGIAGSALSVRLSVTSPQGSAVANYKIAGDSAGWTPSARFAFPDVRDANGEQTVTIELAPVDASAVWLVDDVMVDPWRAK